ncbi:MAG: flagellar biosynthetic protein FliO [Acidobacteriota bacterium]
MIGLLLDAAPASGVDTGLMRAFFGLLFVFALIGGLAYLVRRGVISIPARRRASSLGIEATLPLGDRRSLLVVNVEGRRLLIGSTATSVSLVTELAAPAGPFEHALDRASGSQAVARS